MLRSVFLVVAGMEKKRERDKEINFQFRFFLKVFETRRRKSQNRQFRFSSSPPPPHPSEIYWELIATLFAVNEALKRFLSFQFGQTWDFMTQSHEIPLFGVKLALMGFFRAPGLICTRPVFDLYKSQFFSVEAIKENKVLEH